VTENKVVALAVFTSILQEGYFTPSEKPIKKQGKVLEIFAF
jgi:hypothetical protein